MLHKALILALLLSTTHVASADNQPPSFGAYRIAGSEDLTIDIEEIINFQFWIGDPDGGYEVQEVFLDFRFDNKTKIKLSYDFELWTVEEGEMFIQVITSDSWVDREIKRLDLSVQFYRVDKFETLDIYAKAVDITGLESPWGHLEPSPVLAHTLDVPDEVESSPSVIWVLLIVGLPMILLYLIARGSGKHRMLKNPAYMGAS